MRGGTVFAALVSSVLLLHSVVGASDKTAASEPWLYYDVNGRGPSNWGHLKGEYTSCNDGRKQSPINLNVVAGSEKLKPLAFGGVPEQLAGVSVSVHNTQRSIRLDVKEERSAGYFEDKESHTRYWFRSVELKSPSEHTVGHGRFPLELQITAERDREEEDGHKKAVISVLYEESAGFSVNNEHLSFLSALPGLPLPAFDHYLDGGANLEERGGVPDPVLPTIAELMPGATYYRYEGSETVPPCHENVMWYVMGRPGTVGSAQVAALRSAMAFQQERDEVAANYSVPLGRFFEPGNARPVQPLNAREVVAFLGTERLESHSGDNDDDALRSLGIIGVVTGCLAIFLLGILPCCLHALTGPAAASGHTQPVHSPAASPFDRVS